MTLRVPKGVKVIDDRNLRLMCEVCGQVFAPNILPGGRLRRHAKECPHGCTARLADARMAQVGMREFHQDYLRTLGL